jgi:hypothetical protein
LIEVPMRARWGSSRYKLSPPAHEVEAIEGDDMTTQVWGIVIGMALMFAVSLQRYRHSLEREQGNPRLHERSVLGRLRERYGL